jgi:hypothetical protein
VGGAPVRVRRLGGRFVALVDLRGRGPRTVRVRVVSIARGGLRHTELRRFRTCG